MNTAEKLARQIRRVAGLRDRLEAEGRLYGLALDLVDAALERACKAIGRGDDGCMEAVGLELEGIQP